MDLNLEGDHLFDRLLRPLDGVFMNKYFIVIIGVILFSSDLTAQGIRYSGNGKMILERTIVVYDNHQKTSPNNVAPIDKSFLQSSVPSASSAADGMAGGDHYSLQKAMAFNLSPYTPTGWSAPIVISNTPSATKESATDAPTIYDTDNIYVSFASLNNGVDPTPTGIIFYCYIYIDDVLKFEGNYSLSLQSNYFVFWINRPVGTLSAGTHTFRMEIDPTNVLSESNESDNTYQRTKSISTVSSVPVISSFNPASGAAGVNVTINGTNFGNTQGTSIIRFGTSVASVVSWSNTQIVAVVPVMTAGAYTISVLTIAGTGSSTSLFTVAVSVTYPDPIPPLYKTTVSTGITGSYVNTMIERFGVVWMTGDFGVVANAPGITAGTPVSWSLVNNGIPSDEDIYAIEFASSTLGFVGTGTGKIYRTTDGGLSWTLVYYNPSVTNFINHIKFDNTSTGIAQGDGLDSSSAMAYLYTTDGGSTWNNRNSQLLGATSISQVYHVSTSAGYIASDYVSGSQFYRGVFRTTNGGMSWSFYSVGNTSRDSSVAVMAIGFQSAALGIALKADSTVWKTTNSGAVWRKIGQLPRMGYGVRFTSLTNALIAGRNGMVAQVNTAANLLYSVLLDPAATFFFPEYSSTYGSVLLPVYSEVRSYYSSLNPSIPLTTPNLISPSNTSTGNGTMVSLSWSSVTGATAYDVEFGPAISSVIKGRVSTVFSSSTTLFDLSAGTDYHWRVRARNVTNSSVWSPTYSFTTASQQMMNDVLSASFPLSPTASTDYRLVTVPTVASAIVEDFLPGSPPNDYRIFEDNGGNPPDHLSELSASSSLTIGKGYWLVKKKNFVISAPLIFPSPSTTTGSVSVSTRSGWNIIGTPYSVPVKWSDIRTANTLNETVVAYGYFGTKGFLPVDILEPFAGYYYYSAFGGSLRIPYPFTETPDLITQMPAYSLTLVHSSSRNTDRTLTIGVDGSAQTGMDDFEMRKPPIFADQAAIWIDRPEWDAVHSRFAADIRPALGDGQTWDVVLQHPAGEHSRLSLEKMNEIPEGFDVVIIDKKNGVILAPDAQNGVTVPQREGNSVYSVIIGRQSYIRSQTEQFIPQHYTLHQNYPNPFNPVTAIRFGITDNALVQVKVYDMLGRETASVVNGVLMSGNHEYSFDARHLASGTYIYSLRAVSVQDGRTLFTSSKKMILLK